MREQKKNIRVVGIDYGTGFSKIAYLDDTGQPKTIPNLDGELKTASVAYFGEGLQEVLVGRSALSMMFVEPARTVKEAKRDIGTDKVYLSDDGVKIDPERVATEVVKYLRESAKQYSGDKLAAQEAVVTVPANFLDNQRQAIKHAAEKAGIRVLALVNEPMAAALAFGLSEKRGDCLVIVLDFGEGTFDTSVIQFAGGKADVIASAGDSQLGGKDVDDILMGMVKERFKAEHGVEVGHEECPAEWYGIWAECVRNKELLSSKREVRLVARALGKQVVLEIKREQLNKAISPLMSRVKKVVLEVLQEAKVSVGDVNQVLCIGGSSRLSAFQKLVAEIFGKEKILGGSVSPDLAVAEGAAIKAGQIVWKSGALLVDEKLRAIPAPAIESTDVMPHSLGVAVQQDVSSAEFCDVLLKRNTSIPCTVTRLFGSLLPDQDRFKVMVLQGEQNQDLKQCLIVGEKELSLPARSPDQESIEVTMGYDESGMVNVMVRDMVSGKTADITVDRYQKKN